MAVWVVDYAQRFAATRLERCDDVRDIAATFAKVIVHGRRMRPLQMEFVDATV